MQLNERCLHFRDQGSDNLFASPGDLVDSAARHKPQASEEPLCVGKRQMSLPRSINAAAASSEDIAPVVVFTVVKDLPDTTAPSVPVYGR
jgi:hypothetical protein